MSFAVNKPRNIGGISDQDRSRATATHTSQAACMGRESAYAYAYAPAVRTQVRDGDISTIFHKRTFCSIIEHGIGVRAKDTASRPPRCEQWNGAVLHRGYGHIYA